jgi:hypothetical protein
VENRHIFHKNISVGVDSIFSWLDGVSFVAVTDAFVVFPGFSLVATDTSVRNDSICSKVNEIFLQPGGVRSDALTEPVRESRT